MGKKLSEMTLEEVWRVFPIYLTEHNDDWAQWYDEEMKNLRHILPDKLIHINHIGSTAIDGIWAKPIIDILIEVPNQAALKVSKEKLVAHGYICMSDMGQRVSLNKGYTEEGFAERVFHIHLRMTNDHDEIFFRDYLNRNPQIAKEYEKLKLSLWKKYEYDRDQYTSAKTEFITTYTKLAKKFLGNQ